MAVRRLTRDEARQMSVRAQRLDADRPTDLVALVDQLTLLQIDPTAAVAPSADLVAWSRLGTAYGPADLTLAVEVDRSLFELRAFIRPVSALAWHVPERTAYTEQTSVGSWVKANDGFRRDLLARLREAGPLLSRDLPDACQVPWGSTGWTNNRNVTQMLVLLSARGEVAIAGRVGGQRLWDVAERVYPPFTPLPPEQARRVREERRLRSLGIARARTRAIPGEPMAVGDAGVPVTVTGWTASGEPIRRAGPALHRAYGPALPLRPADPRPGRNAGPLRLHLHPGDVQAGGAAALGLLRAAGAAARPAGGQAGRPRRPESRGVPGARGEDGRWTRAVRADVAQEVEALAGWLGLPVVRA